MFKKWLICDFFFVLICIMILIFCTINHAVLKNSEFEMDLISWKN